MNSRRLAPWKTLRTIGCVVAVAVLSTQGASAGPRVDYILHCQGCHLDDGRGSPGHVPSLRGDIGRLVSVPGGREFLIRVPGVSQSELSDSAVAAVLNWMLVEFSSETLPPDSPPFDAAEVARHRGSPLLSVEASRAEVMLAVRALEEHKRGAGQPLR